MAWFNNGNYDGVRIDNLTTILAEFCWAINEREDLFGDLFPTTWPIAGKRFPVASDFSGMRRDTDLRLLIATIRQNMKSRHTSIDAIHTKGATDETEFSGIALGSTRVLSEGSYGDTWLPLTYQTDYRIYDQIKEALDIIVYYKTDTIPRSLISQVDERRVAHALGVNGDTTNAEVLQAWNSAYNALGTLAGVLSEAHLTMTYGRDISNLFMRADKAVVLTSDGTRVFDLSSHPGIFTKGQIGLEAKFSSNDSSPDRSLDAEITFASSAGDVSIGPAPDDVTENEVYPFTYNVGGTMPIPQVSMALPGSVPFPNSAFFPDQVFRGFEVSGYLKRSDQFVMADISGDLTFG